MPQAAMQGSQGSLHRGQQDNIDILLLTKFHTALISFSVKMRQK